MNYKILFKQNYSADKVSIEETTSSRLIDQKLESECNSEWNRLLQESKTTGKELWDSEVYRYEKIIPQDVSLKLRLSTIPFSIRISMNSLTGLVNDLGFDYAARGMYTSIFVITKDNKYVFIERSDKYIKVRIYAFIGGVLSTSENELNNGNDLFKEVEKECIEETGCANTDIEEVTLNAMYITESLNICLLFTAILKITFAELVTKFDLGNDGEAKSLINFTKKEIPSFVQELH